MENSPEAQYPDDPRSVLAGADQARQRLPTGLHPVLGAAVAFQVGAGAYGIAAQTVVGLAVALAGVAVLMGVAALLLYQFRRINGVRVDGLSSQIVLGTGGTSTLIYMVGFGAATWAAFESHWWLVAAAAVAARVSYASGTLRWWHAYRRDPLIHAPARLQVLTTLSAVSEAEFATLRDALKVSDSVLSKHISTLAGAGYVRSRKGVRAGRRTTWIGLTSAGRKALREHVAALRQLIDVVE